MNHQAPFPEAWYVAVPASGATMTVPSNGDTTPSGFGSLYTEALP